MLITMLIIRIWRVFSEDCSSFHVTHHDDNAIWIAFVEFCETTDFLHQQSCFQKFLQKYFNFDIDQ